jgi:predicted nucleic acid-binding protein
MTYKKIFLDSDILLDTLLKREPFVIYSRVLFSDKIGNTGKLCTSALILANIYYVISRNLNKQVAATSVKYLLGLVEILAFEGNHINSAINSEHPDFEDCIQYFIAKQNNCDLIISRNTKHYKKFDIPVLTAEEYLRNIL